MHFYKDRVASFYCGMDNAYGPGGYKLFIGLIPQSRVADEGELIPCGIRLEARVRLPTKWLPNRKPTFRVEVGSDADRITTYLAKHPKPAREKNDA